MDNEVETISVLLGAARRSTMARMNGVQRLEVKNKTSQKFWEAEVRDKTLLTRWGRIGTKGQEKKKTFPSSYAAGQAFETQLEEKLKKGYKRAKTAAEIELEKPPAKKPKRNPDLEAAILKDIDDPKAWLVYADWLQGEGDPRGELIVVQYGLEEKKKNAKLAAREKEILEESGAALLGPLRKHMQSLDHRNRDTFTWRRGFLSSVYVSYNSYARAGQAPVDVPKHLATILAHPSAALVDHITLGEYNTGVWDKKRGSSQVYEPLVDAIAKAKPKALRKLVVGEYEFPDDTEISWVHIGSLGKIWAACPRLEQLTVQGGKIELGKIDAPALREARFITGGLPRKAAQSIAVAKWPKLERLEVWLGDSSYGAGATIADLAPIFEGKNLPALVHLGLRNSEIADEIAEALAKSKILRQLESLDLSMGTMTDEGALALAKGLKSAKRLTSVDVSGNYLSASGAAAIKKVVKTVKAKDQRGSEEGRRYVAVGE